MKRILITGANSYIGVNLEKWLSSYNNQYEVKTLDMTNENWVNMDFTGFDVVFHVAGIAHVSANVKMKEKYYKVNTDLPIRTAKKAQKDGVKQFIFMSSIIVYGNVMKIIDANTVPTPTNFYGDSKLKAEEGLQTLQNDRFKIVIIRPPMIYGQGSKGNYPRLSKIAKRIHIFPDFDNKRSMLYIDSLCEFVRLMIDNEENGLFFPQNKEYVNTSSLVKMIAAINGRKVILTKIFNSLLKLALYKKGIIYKVFGSLCYDMELSSYKNDYRIKNFQESILATELELVKNESDNS